MDIGQIVVKEIPQLALYKIANKEKVVESGIVVLTEEGTQVEKFKTYAKILEKDNINILGQYNTLTDFITRDVINYIQKNPFTLNIFHKIYYNTPEQGLVTTIEANKEFTDYIRDLYKEG